MGIFVRKGEQATITGKAIGGDAADMPAEARAALDAATRSARRGSAGNSGVANFGGTVRITDATVTDGAGQTTYVEDITLRPGQSLP